MSIFPKISLTVFLLRFFIITLYSCWNFWSYIFGICIILCLFVGVFGSLTQTKIKRFLAYASIVQVGSILLSFCAISRFGVLSCLLFLIIYIFTVLGTFCVIFASRNFTFDYRFQFLCDFRFFIWYNPILCFFLTSFLLSFAGMPPFGGFFAKMFILFSGAQSGLIFLSTLLLLFNVVGCFYYIHIIKVLCFESLEHVLSSFLSGIGLISRIVWYSLIPVSRENGHVLCSMSFLISVCSYFSSYFFETLSFLSFQGTYF